MLAVIVLVLQLDLLILAYKTPEVKRKLAIDAYIIARQNKFIRKKKDIRRFIC